MHTTPSRSALVVSILTLLMAGCPEPEATPLDTGTSDVPASETDGGNVLPDTNTADLDASGDSGPDATLDTSQETSPDTVTDTVMDAQPDTTQPDIAQPDTTVPDTTVPDTTVPDTTQPDTTVPDTTQPDTTVPDTTQPDTTAPDTSTDIADASPDTPDTSNDGDGSTTPDGLGPPLSGATLYLTGHSLFNLEMPSYLAAMATDLGKAHQYNMQMGIGSNMALRLSGGNEQDKDGASMTYTVQNEISSANTVAASAYDTLMVTEAVDIFDQLLYAESVTHLRTFYDLLVASNPDGRVFFYDSWDAVEGGDYAGWATHTEGEFIIWECIVAAVNSDSALASNPVRQIPGGVALAAAVSAAAEGTIPNLPGPAELFGPDGHHLTALGNYFIALTQFAVLYQQSPQGAPLTYSGVNNPLTVPQAQATALETLAWQSANSFVQLTATTPSLSECEVAVQAFCDGNNYCEGLVTENLNP